MGASKIVFNAVNELASPEIENPPFVNMMMRKPVSISAWKKPSMSEPVLLKAAHNSYTEKTTMGA